MVFELEHRPTISRSDEETVIAFFGLFELLEALVSHQAKIDTLRLKQTSMATKCGHKIGQKTILRSKIGPIFQIAGNRNLQMPNFGVFGQFWCLTSIFLNGASFFENP